MMVDARVEGVQLFNIHWEGERGHEGVQFRFLWRVESSECDAVVVKAIPEDITLLKTIFRTGFLNIWL